MNTYRVTAGDTLFNIAERFYNDGALYPSLALYNGLADPNALEIGQVLTIPPREELAHPLAGWHNYRNGSIQWRVTDAGVEVKGKGLLLDVVSTQYAAEIWQRYQQAITTASDTYGVPVPVIIATILTESGGKADAYRYEPAFYDRYIKEKTPWTDNPYYSEPTRISASYGLMQIMYTTACDVGFRGEPEDLYDSEQNIDAGTRYIASSGQRTSHGWDPPKIACAYNAGSVRATNKNAWGMHHHPGHLDRWIPAYNGAIEVTGLPGLPDDLLSPSKLEPPSPLEDTSQPQPSIPPQKDRAELTFIFPQKTQQGWKPVIIDMFPHHASGLGDPVSTTIRTPSHQTHRGYYYGWKGLEPGVYDIVFTDEQSHSVIHDVMDYELEARPQTLDLRTYMAAEQTVMVRLLFPKPEEYTWKPLIVDFFRCDEKSGQPVSYTITTPKRGVDGYDSYEIPAIPRGRYDLVFTDAATSSVIYDLSGYMLKNVVEAIDLRPAFASTQERGVHEHQGWGAVLKTWWQHLWK